MVSVDTKVVIVALDFPDEESTRRMLDKLDPELCRVKVGKELFTRCGPQLVETIVKEGFDVFLDMKYHDIPNTTAAAVKAAAELGVWMVNVHASGGLPMLKAARSAVSPSDGPLLIGVTVLTSMEREDLLSIGLDSSPEEQVKRLARLCSEAGLDGVVCSAREAPSLREEHSSEFLLVTPGIRTTKDSSADQKRIETPASAIEKGSNYLVIGRPITQDQNPLEKLKKIQMEISGKN